jgi:hypothetical protein
MFQLFLSSHTCSLSSNEKNRCQQKNPRSRYASSEIRALITGGWIILYPYRVIFRISRDNSRAIAFTFLEEAGQGNAIWRDTVGGFSPGAKAAFWASHPGANLREGGEIPRGRSLATPATVLAESDIEHPMPGVFDPAVARASAQVTPLPPIK